MTRLFTIRAVSTITALLMTTVLVPATASALITANDADDVCPPATDPASSPRSSRSSARSISGCAPCA
ncbi:MAG: hypothetical protein E4H03_04580 [Myxococcales bacterium]|nr:MAG: hypothetical protein E4H03_04580 [Myxococcales bacterium]